MLRATDVAQATLTQPNPGSSPGPPSPAQHTGLTPRLQAGGQALACCALKAVEGQPQGPAEGSVTRVCLLHGGPTTLSPTAPHAPPDAFTPKCPWFRLSPSHRKLPICFIWEAGLTTGHPKSPRRGRPSLPQTLKPSAGDV